MTTTELIPSLNNFIFGDETDSDQLQIKSIIYRADKSQIAPQITITYLVKRIEITRPPETIGNSWKLTSFSMTKSDSADYDTFVAAYTAYTSAHGDPYLLNQKMCKKILFMSMTNQEYKDYQQQQAGQIDTAKIDTHIKLCSDDFSGGFKAQDVLIYVAGLVGISIQVQGLYNYYIRQYRVTEGQSLLNIIQNLYGFMQPLITYINGTIVLKADSVCSTKDGLCDFTFPEYSQVRYNEHKLKDKIDGIIFEGGTGLFDKNKTQAKLGERHKVCLTSEAWAGNGNGNGSTGTSCYEVDEFGRKILISTEKWDYSSSAGGISIFGGSGGGVIKTLSTTRSYNYNNINYEEPILIAEEIWGKEIIVTTDDENTKVAIGGICDICGSKRLNYASDTFALNSIAETQSTWISPVTTITTDSGGTIDYHDNEAIEKVSTKTEIYKRSNSEEYGVSVAQTNSSPVFQQAKKENTTTSGTMPVNTKVVVDHVETSSDTSFQESFGEPTRGVSKRRKMQIKSSYGTTGTATCSANVLKVTNPLVVIAADADRIVYDLHNTIQGNWLCRAEITTHDDKVFPVGAKLPNSDSGVVVSQEISLNIGSGTLGFDLNNTIVVEGRYIRDDN